LEEKIGVEGLKAGDDKGVVAISNVTPLTPLNNGLFAMVSS